MIALKRGAEDVSVQAALSFWSVGHYAGFEKAACLVAHPQHHRRWDLEDAQGQVELAGCQCLLEEVLQACQSAGPLHGCPGQPPTCSVYN